MIDRFLAGTITGVIALAAVTAIDTQRHVSILIAVGIYMIGYIIANKLEGK